MGKVIDLTGQKFGRLTVVSKAENDKHGKALWICVCECGRTSTSIGSDLRRGHTISCGCFGRERRLGSLTTHGLHSSSEYGIWTGLIRRCTSPSHKQYRDYGGRGITVCDRWLTFDNFYFDMGPRPSKAYSIDRVDNDGPYSPENCRWATDVTQSNNRRNNRILAINGQTKTMAQWGKLRGLGSSVICKRIERGWPIDESILQPVKKKAKST